MTEIERSDLETAPNGLYRIKGEQKRGDYYDPTDDTFRADVDQSLIARIDDGKEMPKGVELATIRPDGKRLILGWVDAQSSWLVQS